MSNTIESDIKTYISLMKNMGLCAYTRAQWDFLCEIYGTKSMHQAIDEWHAEYERK